MRGAQARLGGRSCAAGSRPTAATRGALRRRARRARARWSPRTQRHPRARPVLRHDRPALDALARRRTLYRLSRERQKPDAEREPGYQERDLRRIRERLERLDRRFDPSVDRAAPGAHCIAALRRDPGRPARRRASTPGSASRATTSTRPRSTRGSTRCTPAPGSASSSTRLGWIEADPDGVREERRSVHPARRRAVRRRPGARAPRRRSSTGRFDAGRGRASWRRCIAYRESRGEPVYPDANGTLRVTYGTVKGYSPRDGVFYTPFTTAGGDPARRTPARTRSTRRAALLRGDRARRASAATRRRARTRCRSTSSATSTRPAATPGSPTLNGQGRAGRAALRRQLRVHHLRLGLPARIDPLDPRATSATCCGSWTRSTAPDTCCGRWASSPASSRRTSRQAIPASAPVPDSRAAGRAARAVLEPRRREDREAAARVTSAPRSPDPRSGIRAESTHFEARARQPSRSAMEDDESVRSPARRLASFASSRFKPSRAIRTVVRRSSTCAVRRRQAAGAPAPRWRGRRRRDHVRGRPPTSR